MRIGFGYDVHQLVEGRKLILGGVEIPFDRGLLGHSDADVLLHAIADALLGAVGEKDLGHHFPDSDPAYKDISSLEILKKVYALVQEKNYKIENIDTTIVAERPKVGPFIDEMRKNISSTLEISPQQANVKATSTEGLGPMGRGDGIAAYASVLLKEERN